MPISNVTDIHHAVCSRDAAQLERVLDVWEPLLPSSMVEHVMQTLVLPRLSQVQVTVQNVVERAEFLALHSSTVQVLKPKQLDPSCL